MPEGRWPRGVDDQFLLGPIIPRSEEYLAIGIEIHSSSSQAFTKCRRHAKDEALMEDPLRPGKKIPWTYVDPTSDYSFRFLTWARFAGWFFSSMTV